MSILIFALYFAVYYALHSVLASNQAKTYLQKFIPKPYYRLFFNIVAIALLGLLFFIYKNVATTLVFSFENSGLHWLGAIAALLGTVLLLLALRQYDLGEFSGVKQLDGEASQSSSTLKTSGINALVRHPLYFGVLWMVWGYFVFHPLDVHLVVAIITSIYIYVGSVLEERKLVEEFGAAYLDYQKDVKMLIPFLF